MHLTLFQVQRIQQLKKKKDEILVLSKVIFQWGGNEHQRNKSDNFRELLLNVIHTNIR